MLGEFVRVFLPAKDATEKRLRGGFLNAPPTAAETTFRDRCNTPEGLLAGVEPQETTHPKAPTRRQLIKLMQEGKLHPEGFLDVIEKRLEEGDGKEFVSFKDLHDLYRSGRLSREEYEDLTIRSVEAAPPSHEIRSLTEQYQEKGVEMEDLSEE